MEAYSRNLGICSITRAELRAVVTGLHYISLGRKSTGKSISIWTQRLRWLLLAVKWTMTLDTG
ncbi:hypothetical protein LINPERPRIM_LOCUS15891 [Linum perenne]